MASVIFNNQDIAKLIKQQVEQQGATAVTGILKDLLSQTSGTTADKIREVLDVFVTGSNIISVPGVPAMQPTQNGCVQKPQ